MKILICTNGKKHSKDAIRFAGKLFQGLKPEVTLLYIKTSKPRKSKISGPRKSEHSEDFLMEEAERLNKINIKTETKVLINENIVQGILEEKRKGNYNLLVLGSRGVSSILPGISSKILGDLPSDILKHVSISTLIVKEPEDIDKVLISTDGSSSAEEAIRFWGKLNKMNSKENKSWQSPSVNLINVIPEFYSRFKDYLGPVSKEQLDIMGSLPGGRTKILYKAKKVLNEYGIKAKIELREGHLAQEILKEADRDYDLIVMGRKGQRKSTFGHNLIPIVHQSKIPVLVIKSKS